MPPIAQGMTSLARLSGLVMATNAPSSPNAAMPATPMLGLRRAMQPNTMATSAIAPEQQHRLAVRAEVRHQVVLQRRRQPVDEAHRPPR